LPLLWCQLVGPSFAALLSAKPPQRDGMGILVAWRLFGRFAGRLCCYRGGEFVKVAWLA
jgi:hypothetical protein